MDLELGLTPLIPSIAAGKHWVARWTSLGGESAGSNGVRMTFDEV